RGVGKLAWTLIEEPLTSADAAEVEAQHRKAALNESIVKTIDNLIVHRAPELRVRMQDDSDRCAGLRLMMIASLDAAGRPIDDHFGHFLEPFLPARPPARLRRNS